MKDERNILTNDIKNYEKTSLKEYKKLYNETQRYLDFLPPASYYIGEQFSASSGYSLEDTPYASSFAGYKDWFIQNYNLPGYTVEVGEGENPLPLTQFNDIYSDILGILVLGTILV